MWNLLGFGVMVGVLLVARWALTIWDSRPHPDDDAIAESVVYTAIPGPRAAATPPVRR